jgi:hypothetical protein
MHRLPSDEGQELAAGEEAFHIKIYDMACLGAADEPQLH